MRRSLAMLLVMAGVGVVGAPPASAVARSVTAVVSVPLLDVAVEQVVPGLPPSLVDRPRSGPAVSADAPSGSFSTDYYSYRVGRGSLCDGHLGTWRYSDGMGSTLSGHMLGPSNCDVTGLPVTVHPPLLVHHIDLQVDIGRGTGAFSGATGGGTLDAVIAGALVGVLQLDLTTPG